MNNGCICCTVRGDLVRSLFELAEHRSQFDTVVIETTGLAEPAPVAQSLYADERIRSEFTLDGVVTIVDAKHISAQLEESAEACEQIAFADLILLNKTDLSTPEALDEIEKDIGRLNKVAKVHRTRNSELDLGAVFDLGSTELVHKIDVLARGHPPRGHHHTATTTTHNHLAEHRDRLHRGARRARRHESIACGFAPDRGVRRQHFADERHPQSAWRPRSVPVPGRADGVRGQTRTRLERTRGEGEHGSSSSAANSMREDHARV